MASTAQVDRLSLLTYLSSLYHALEENPCIERTGDQKDPEKYQDESLDPGRSVEEESICSSCSSSSGYASPVGKGRKENPSEMKVEPGDISDTAESKDSSIDMDLAKTKVKEAKEKFEKATRRSGAEARRESRRLVKSLCEENAQDRLGAKNPSLCDLGERETPFLVAFRKFSSLALSQSKIPVATSCTYEKNGMRGASVKGKNSCTSIDIALTEAPKAFNSLITRATQTEEERQSAAVQTGSKTMLEPTSVTPNVEPAIMITHASEVGVFNHSTSILAASKTVKTHQRKTSIHSRQQAFQLAPHLQPHVGNLHQANPSRKFHELQSPHLSMQVLPQQEYKWPGSGLEVLPKYKRDSRRSNLRSSKSTPHLYLHTKKPSIDLPHHFQDPRHMGHKQLVSGLPQTFSTLV